jgi:hypothetical protein
MGNPQGSAQGAGVDSANGFMKFHDSSWAEARTHQSILRYDLHARHRQMFHSSIIHLLPNWALSEPILALLACRLSDGRGLSVCRLSCDPACQVRARSLGNEDQVCADNSASSALYVPTSPNCWARVVVQGRITASNNNKVRGKITCTVPECGKENR